MQVPNDSWVQVGADSPATLTMQNVGYTRIGYVLQDSALEPPQSDDELGADPYVEIDTDQHFILAPGSEQIVFTYLASETLSVFVRSLGPKVGALAFVET